MAILNLSVSLDYQNIIVVAKSGGEYGTITEAVANARDSADNPVTILVMPGVYKESVDIAGRNIAIVGVNKQSCIIRNDSGDYYTPPLNISGGGNYLANLTILATHDDGWNPPIPSYAVHCDAEGKGTTEIFNCNLISKQQSGIGIGLHDKQTLILRCCEIYKNDINKPSNGGSIYMHNQQWGGATEQKLIVDNCKIYTDTGYAIVIEDANHRPGGTYDDKRDSTISFYGNTFWSNEMGKDGIIGGDKPLDADSMFGYIKLTEDSHGNNLEAFNA